MKDSSGRSARNRFAIGAQVEVHTPEGVLHRTLRAGRSYLTGNPAELYFGLGAADSIQKVVVTWPSGETTEHQLTGVDQVWTIEQK